MAHALSRAHEVRVFVRQPSAPRESPLDQLAVTDFDFILLAVPDDAIKKVARQLPPSQAIVLHMSGTRPIADLSNHKKRGVWYPLQTFTKEKALDFSEIHFFLEASPDAKTPLKQLSESLSPHFKWLDSSARSTLHLSAVFACNFSNHMYHIAENHLQKIGLEFRDLLPLVHETVEKAASLKPSRAQTGPAIRKDTSTLEKHTAQLSGDEKKIYELVSKHIQKTS